MMAKTLIATTALICAGATFAHADNPTKEPAIYSKVFVPRGFDSNDVVQIVATGTFENGCYRPAETSARVDEGAKRIYLTAAAYKYNGLCTQMVLPFDRVVDVGIVPAGEYQIMQESQSDVLGKITIKEAAKNEPDDFTYAPVSQAYIDDNGKGKDKLVIRGIMPTDCMKVEDVKITHDDNVLMAQPIVKVEQRKGCAVGTFPFRKEIDVKAPKGEYLLHVRSMNAKAINNLIDVQ